MMVRMVFTPSAPGASNHFFHDFRRQLEVATYMESRRIYTALGIFEETTANPDFSELESDLGEGNWILTPRATGFAYASAIPGTGKSSTGRRNETTLVVDGALAEDERKDR